MNKKSPEGVICSFGWEDGECALIEKLVCPCGFDLLEGEADYTVSHETIIECPKCQRKYKFVWIGMTVEEVKE